MAESKTNIPVVIIGLSRHIGLKMISQLFQNTPYEIVAVLDLDTSPESYRYTPQNLGVVLNALHPRPRAIIFGAAMDPKHLPDVENMCQEFNENIKQESSEDGVAESGAIVFSPLTRTIVDGVTRSPADLARELLGQMDAIFRPENATSHPNVRS